jgi:hypothetical protein
MKNVGLCGKNELILPLLQDWKNFIQEINLLYILKQQRIF